MPELKHNFIRGRMNKDLDERVVPNGEYRDAVNIQVSSSENSDVGTIQNILGNVLVDDYVEGLYPEKAACIATVADEKNDSVYFFVQQVEPRYVMSDSVDVTFKIQDGKLLYRSREDIAAFQFNHNGCAINAENAGWDFSVSASNSTVIGFQNMIDSVIPAGHGTLVTVGDGVTQGCLSNFIISDTSGNALTVAPLDGDYANRVLTDLPYFSFRDLIIEHAHSIGVMLSTDPTPSRLEPVFVDTYKTFCRLNMDVVYQSLWAQNIYTLTIPTVETDGPNDQPPAIKNGMTVSIYDAVSGQFSTHKVIRTSISSEFLSGIPGSNALVEVELDTPIQWAPTGNELLTFSSPKVLFPWSNKQKSWGIMAHTELNYITGINIIDNLLFWTDDVGEPKKINIKDSKDGTRILAGFAPFPTCLAYKEQWNYNNIPSSFLPNSWIAPYKTEPAAEQHITVIKKSPKTAPTLEMYTNREDGINYSGVITITSAPYISDSSILDNVGNSHPTNYDFSPYSIGDTIYLKIDSNLDGNSTFDLTEWYTAIMLGINPAVVLKEYTDNGTQPSTPITNYRIKGNVIDWVNANYDSASGDVKVAIKITSIDGFPPTPDAGAGTRNYVIDTFLDDEKLFEFKFPRFAYRWKYKDGEYSCFSPFSEIAFLPGTFDYHPKKGYNLGMVNRLKHVNINNFFNREQTPDDVVEIDILYKDEVSTNIYVVTTLKSSDEIFIPLVGVTLNHWEWNTFRLSSETIQSIVPSNQLLRPWDNVPKQALSQEIVGNRIVYGNYLQNFDLLENTLLKGPYNLSNFNFYIESTSVPYSFTGKKSIKSLREYQLGVVFTDEYDRQTPVISSGAAAVKVDKSYSWKSNNFSISFNQSYPVNMDRFKFFIKETAEEYYNMAMDRFYNAEDGNIWLAFPSSDRNKIDIDTFLILKKGLDDSVQVTETARYKVLAIDNGAPDFIKTSKVLISEETHSTTLNDIFGNTMAGAPGLSDSSFSVNYDVFYGTSGANMHEIDDTLYVEFAQSDSNQVSNRYEVTELTCDWDEESDTLASSKYHFRIKESFSSDVTFITDDPTGLNSTSISAGTKMRVYRYKVENKPEFDGRFFVKILIDDVFSKYIKKVYEEVGVDYKIVASRDLYKLPKDFSDNVWSSTASNIGFDYAKNAYNQLAHYKTEFKSWFQDYKFQNGSSSGTPYTGVNIIYEGPEYTDHWTWEDSFCETAYGWTMYYHCIANPTSGYDAHNDITNFNSTPPPAYWFIDEGIFRGYRWNEDMNTKYGEIGPAGSVYQNSNDSAYDFKGTGITPDPINQNWTLDLGFGGIWSNEWQWKDPDVNWINTTWVDGEDGADDNNYHTTYDTIEDFYKIGITGGNIKHVNQSDIVSKLIPGQRFRFAEDPLKTIYTLRAGVDQNNRIRYRRNDEKMPDDGAGAYMIQNQKGDWADTTNAGYYVAGIDFIHPAAQHDNRQGTSERINTAFTNPANFTKNFGLTVEPEITWDPTAISATGLIDGGYDLTLTTPLSGSTCLDCDNWSIPNDFQLILDSILGLDATTGVNIQLTVGMALSEYTDMSTSTVTNPPQNMIVKSIQYDGGSDKYYVGLTGSEYAHKSTQNFKPKINTSLKFGQPVMNGFSPIFIENYHHNLGYNTNDILFDAVGYTLEFIEPIDDIEIMPENPAVWETEPKENTPLDIYYEASGSLPTVLDSTNFFSLLSKGTYQSAAFSTIDIFHVSTSTNELNLGVVKATDLNSVLGITLNQVGSPVGFPCIEPGGCVGSTLTETILGDELIIHGHNVNINIPIIGFDGIVTSGGEEYAEYFIIDTDLFKNGTFKPSWFNCYSFGNGVESNRIRDNFNLPYIKNGVKVSTTVATQYKEERRSHGLIYSGIYNSISGTNNLNQFIQAEKITKDINPSYGSVQKLFTRDSDLIALCEDKVLRILANKDALYNADGNPQLTATGKVLGQTIPFVGDYGISKNPESFASESYRAYFTDRVRGAVLRLSRDGLTAISDHGMRDWFRDRMKVTGKQDDSGFIALSGIGTISGESKILGSFDDRQKEYNVTFNPLWNISDFNPMHNDMGVFGHTGETVLTTNIKHTVPVTVSFREDSKGWVSFKSFVPEQAISGNNDYFTFKRGKMWKHHIPVTGSGADSSTIINYNTFYGDGNFFPSTFNVLLNDSPEIVKSFKTLNYEGSQSRSILNIEDDQYHNLNTKKGWYVSSIFTNKETGSLKEFIEKEGKWFNYITGNPISTSSDGHLVRGFDAGAFAIQGQGMLKVTPIVIGILGCMDPAAFNYDPLATIDDAGSCIAVENGCTDPAATNYDPNANTDDGSCILPGCTDPTAFNYDANANQDDGSCIATVLGCTNAAMWNYNPAANVDDGSCVPFIYGCTDVTADNYDGAANSDDGSCTYTILGCTGPTACNYDANATVDDGSCLYCNDILANNHDGAGCDSGCEYCETSWDNPTSSETLTQTSSTANSITAEWVVPTVSSQASGLTATVNTYLIEAYDPGGTLVYNTTINATPPGTTMSHTAPGLNINTTYVIQVTASCSNSQGVVAVINASTLAGVFGCTDGTGINNPSGSWSACNYDPSATIDDNSCFYDTCVGCNIPGYIEFCDDCWDPAPNFVNGPPGSGYGPWVSDTNPSSCITLIVLGCTNPTAANYDPSATVDDGSCCYNAGCTDNCANNYDANACYDDGSCTYGELCDGNFYTINSSVESAIPTDISITTDQNNNTITSIWGEVANLSEVDMWRQGVLPTTTSDLPTTCGEWNRFYQPINTLATPTGVGNNETWRERGPINAGNNKLLFESGAQQDGVSYSYSTTANGVYQAFNAPISDSFNLKIVIDNWMPSGGGGTMPRPEGHLQFLVCDGDYNGGGSGLTEGCNWIEDANGSFEWSISSMSDTGLTGMSNHAPDGIEWSFNPNATCTGGTTPCTGSAQSGNDLNIISIQKSLEVPFNGMGPNTILYIAYYDQNKFYDNSGARAFTTDQSYFNGTVTTGQSSKALEVSLIQVINTTTGPCSSNDNNSSARLSFNNSIIEPSSKYNSSYVNNLMAQQIKKNKNNKIIKNYNNNSIK